MKTILKKGFFKAAATVFFSGLIFSQVMGNTPTFGQDGGYWVVETNAQTKDFSIIKFYDGMHQLLYEERLTGRYLDVNKPKHKRMLNKSLKMLETNSLVASQIKQYPQQISVSLSRKRE